MVATRYLPRYHPRMDSEGRLEDSLARFVRAAGLLRPEQRAAGSAGASLSEAFALEEISAGEPLPQRRLVERLSVDKSTVSRLVGSLQAKGWVARERDPEDSRNYLLDLTEEGRSALARMAEARREGHARLLARLAPDEREALLKGLDALVRAMESR